MLGWNDMLQVNSQYPGAVAARIHCHATFHFKSYFAGRPAAAFEAGF